MRKPHKRGPAVYHVTLTVTNVETGKSDSTSTYVDQQEADAVKEVYTDSTMAPERIIAWWAAEWYEQALEDLMAGMFD